MKPLEWRRLLRQLRKCFPVESNVVVKRYPSKTRDGRTVFDGRQCFHIRINSKQPRQGQIDSILHEWAHTRLVERAYRHKGEWGTEYAAIYSTIVGED